MTWLGSSSASSGGQFTQRPWHFAASQTLQPPVVGKMSSCPNQLVCWAQSKESRGMAHHLKPRAKEAAPIRNGKTQCNTTRASLVSSSLVNKNFSEATPDSRRKLLVAKANLCQIQSTLLKLVYYMYIFFLYMCVCNIYIYIYDTYLRTCLLAFTAFEIAQHRSTVCLPRSFLPAACPARAPGAWA